MTSIAIDTLSATEMIQRDIETPVAIRLETSKKRGIDNFQDAEITAGHHRWFRRLSRLHPNAIVRTEPSPLFNCHGLTFASRRTKILDRRNILPILSDDAWDEIEMGHLLPGDVVIYFDDEGDPNHSGIVVDYSPAALVPRVCSKWGFAGEFVHWLNDVPEMYGPVHKFYRCLL